MIRICFILSILLFVEGMEKCSDGESTETALDKSALYTTAALNLVWAVGGMIPAIKAVEGLHSTATIIAGVAGVGATGIGFLQTDGDYTSSNDCTNQLITALADGAHDDIKDNFKEVQDTINTQMSTSCDPYGFNSPQCGEALVNSLKKFENLKPHIINEFNDGPSQVPTAGIIELANLANYHRRVYDIYELWIALQDSEPPTYPTIRSDYLTMIARAYLFYFYRYLPELIKEVLNDDTKFVTPQLRYKAIVTWWNQINFCGWKEYYQFMVEDVEGAKIHADLTSWFTDYPINLCRKDILDRSMFDGQVIHSIPPWKTSDTWDSLTTYDSQRYIVGFKQHYESYQAPSGFISKTDSTATVGLDLYYASAAEQHTQTSRNVLLKNDESWDYKDKSKYGYCNHPDSYISGYRQYGFDEIEYVGNVDNSGNVGFQFVCRNVNTWEITQILSSDYDYLPDVYVDCDDFSCDAYDYYIAGAEHHEPSWTKWVECPIGKYLDSVAAKFDDSGWGDERGLEDIKFKCQQNAQILDVPPTLELTKKLDCQRYLWCSQSPDCTKRDECEAAYLNGDESAIETCRYYCGAQSCWGYEYVDIEDAELKPLCDECNDNYVCPFKLPKFKICVVNQGGIYPQSAATIYLRLRYLWVSGMSVEFPYTSWTELVDNGQFDVVGGCATFEYWNLFNHIQWMEFFTCSSDGLAIDSISYTSSGAYKTVTSFNDINQEGHCVLNNYFWVDTAFYQWNCRAMSVYLPTGDVSVNPPEITATSCPPQDSESEFAAYNNDEFHHKYLASFIVCIIFMIILMVIFTICIMFPSKQKYQKIPETDLETDYSTTTQN